MPPIKTTSSYVWLLVVLSGLIVLAGLSALAIGSAPVPLEVAWRVVQSHLFGAETLNVTSGQDHIIWLIRAPRVVLAALVGSGLAMVGAALQAATRNPLADPHLLGATSGATLGAVIVVMYVGELLGQFTLPLAAFLGATASLMFVMSIARKHGTFTSDRLLLSGVAVSFVLMAGANLLLFLGDHRASSSVLFWMMGGLGAARWELLWLPFFVIVLGGFALWACGRYLNALMTGEQTAVSLGVDVHRIRIGAFILTSCMTGVMVALSGSIGFVGLMVPHMARRLVGAEHRRLIPLCGLLGALLVVCLDILARTVIAPQDLPIGVVSAAIGGMFFILMIQRS
ncbi:iron ABC transporter permease [Pseudomonas sp. EL_65y_Pfl1_R32]|uniref:FecCD family ABC transporter permease n=1 Tax=Pseudomonas sp. EL_65y_Pfl1_R32 TaxID=3088696 RepID=UPI0030D84F07